MNTKYLILLLSLLSFQVAHGQPATMIVFGDCMYSPFAIEDGRHQITFNNSKTLTQHISDNTDVALRKSMRGVVDVQIIIRSDGKVCCKSLNKLSGSFSLDQLRLLKLEDAFNSLPNFTIGKPQIIANMPGNYSTLLRLTFKRKGIIEVFDYLANRII